LVIQKNFSKFMAPIGLLVELNAHAVRTAPCTAVLVTLRTRVFRQQRKKLGKGVVCQ